MEVLAKGRSDKVLPCQITCLNCDAVLLVAKEDCYTRSTYGKRGTRTRVLFVCPECQNEQSSEILQGIADILPTWREHFGIPLDPVEEPMSDAQLPERKTIIITAGGTREHIDDVRYIANHATGELPARMAFLLAKHNDVIFIHAPLAENVMIKTHRPSYGANETGSLTKVPVTSAAEMQTALRHECFTRNPYAVICAAAVADFAPIPVKGKISSTQTGGGPLTLHLYPTPKVIDVVKAACWNTRLLAFKFLSKATEQELYDAATHLVERAHADAVFCNTMESYKARTGTLLIRGVGGATKIPLDGEGQAHLLAERILYAWGFDAEEQQGH